MDTSLDASLTRQPVATDSAEQRIRGLIDQDMLSTNWSRAAFAEAQRLQEEFLLSSKAALQIDDRATIRGLYEELLFKLNETLKTTIIEGEDYLSTLDGKPVIIVTNHLATAKATRISNPSIYPDIEIEPFPIRHAPFAKVSERFQSSIHEVALELPGVLKDIQEAAKVVTIPLTGEGGRTQMLIDDVFQVIKEEGNPTFVMYPEGGTTGKRNGGGLYDLEEFRSGAFVTAANLNIPIVPVCQVVDPIEGLKLSILEPVHVSDVSNAKDITRNIQIKMQEKLNTLK